MNKRKLHHHWKPIKKISYWYFLIASITIAVVAVFALRQNNLNAINLRNQVLTIDKDNGDTEAALQKLRQYVYSHMNTDLASSSTVYPPIQLKYRYDRLVAAEKARVSKSNSDSTYNDAQKYCETNFPQSFYGAGRLPCIRSYIDSHPSTPVEEVQIPDALYKFDFVSPVWSPDLAGWAIVISLVFMLVFLLRIGLEQWFSYEFRKQQ